MKTKTALLLLFTSLALLINCSGGDNDTPKDNSIDGVWNLTNIGGGLAGTNTDFHPGDVIWVFNQKKNTLTIKNNKGNDTSFMLHSGTYKYTMQQNGDTQILFVAITTRMVILSLDTHLTITDDFNDGYTAIFKR